MCNFIYVDIDTKQMESEKNMELILVWGALLFVFLGCLFQRYLVSSTQKLPPGRTGWPVIGESIDFYRHLQKLNMETFFFKRMSKYSPRMFKTSILGDHYAVMCGAEGSKFLFSNSNKLVTRCHIQIIEKLFFTPQFKAVFDTNIKPSFVSFLKSDAFSVAVIDSVAQRHIQSWKSLEIKMYPVVKRYLLALAIRLFMSVDDPDIVEKLHDPLETLTAGMTAMPIDLPGTKMNRAIKAALVLKSHISSIVKHQRSTMESNSSNSEDPKHFLDYIMQELDKDELVAEVIVSTIVGGYDTTSSLICMTLKLLIEHPEAYDKVYQENMEVAAIKKPGEMLTREDTRKMRYTWNVVREVMRLYPVGPLVTREATADFKFAGFDIPKGYKLVASTDALHKNPEYFPEPKKFDPSRFDGDGPLPYTYIPFGGGRFMCPGQAYAQLALLVFVHNVVTKFKLENMISDEKIDGIPHPKPAKGLPLRLFPHAN